MSINIVGAANLTRLLLQVTGLYRPLHRKVSIIFAGIGTAPVGLPSVGLQHLGVCPVKASTLSSAGICAKSQKKLFRLRSKVGIYALFSTGSLFPVSLIIGGLLFGRQGQT